MSPREQAVSRDEAVALAGLIGLLAITAAWWALALWPVADAPVWLERTRYVCFGVTDSGLPDAGGWIGLIGGPLGMLAILLAGWWRGARALLRRARSSTAVAVTLAALVAGCVLLVTGATARVHQARAASFVSGAVVVAPAVYPRLDIPTPPLALTAHDGSARTLADQRGRPVLVTFAFAHCETVCPLIVKDVLEAQARLRSEGTETGVLIVTLDPWRDTPARLPAIAAGWSLPEHDAWLLGGAVADVEAVLDGWAIPRTRDLRTGEVTHPGLVYIIDSEGRITFAANGGALAIAALVRRL